MGSLLLALDVNGGVYSRYGKSNQVENEFTYLENYLFLNFQGASWNLNSEIAYNKPPEYGVRFTGIRTLSLNIIRDLWSLDAGHLTAIFGNGLAFNFFEDKALAFDNRPFGLRFDVELSEQFQLMTLAGTRSKFSSFSPSTIRTPDLFSNYDVGGVQLNYFPDNGSWNGAGYVTGSKFRSLVRIDRLDTETLSIIPEFPEQEAFILNSGITYTLYRENWEWTMEYGNLKKWFDIPLVNQEFDETLFQTVHAISKETGNVFYSQFVGTLPGYSTLTIEYKLYRYGESQTVKKISGESMEDKYRMGAKSMPFNLGPTTLRQHDIGLLANLTHIVDYGDEAGFYADYRKNIGESYLFTGIYAQTSRTSRESKKISSYFPSMNIENFPFQELYFELEYMGYVLQNRTIGAITEFSPEGVTKERYITFIPTYFSRSIGSLVLGGSIGIQKASKGGIEYFNNQYIISVDWKGKYSFALITDITSGFAINGETQWVTGEIVYKPSSILTIRSSYGTEKGGIRCTGGVCRTISPFDGVRMMLEVRL